uniref:Condensin complex subunit 2 n=1 Tax=Timema monikensis TaxID=170555 RepID=A0A7R9HLR3_9NEOP|nr:unnamed protein product [Timema monikensis]
MATSHLLYKDEVIKVRTTEKINIKNAFNLQLIDYMTQMVKKKEFDISNFQVAGCTLDASTKIYSYRVDGVHSVAMRMAGGLHQEEKKKKKGQNDEEENDENQPEGDESITIAKKKKPRRHRNVLAESSSLNAKEDSNPKLDPYFRRLMSALGETQEGDCQFLTSVKVGDDSCALQLFPEIPFWREKQIVQAQQGNFSLPALPELDDLEICSSFSHFTFNNWSLEEDLALEERMKGNRPSGVEGVETPDNPLPLEPDEEFAFDMAASPPPCGGADDYDTEGELGDTGIEIAVTCRAQDKSSLAIVDLHKHLSIAPQEYSYFRGSMLSLWAGPAHWKIRPLSKGKSSTSEVGAKEEAKKRRKKDIFVDFDALLHLEELNEKFSQIKGAKLSRKTVQMWSKERNTFPKDEHFNSEVFYQLEIRKCVIVRRCDPEQSQIVDGQVDDYNYDNEHDRSSYCPNVDEVVWQDIFPMLEIDNPKTRGLPLLHLQQLSTTLQLYATGGLQKLNWKLCKFCSMTRPTSLEFYIEETAPTPCPEPWGSEWRTIQPTCYIEILQYASASNILTCKPQSSSHVRVKDLMTLGSRNRISIPFVTKMVVKKCVCGGGGEQAATSTLGHDGL